MMQRKKDFLFILLAPIIALALSWCLNVSPLVSVLLFYLPQSLYFSFRLKHQIGKTFFFSLTGTLFYLVLGYILEANNIYAAASLSNYYILGHLSLLSPVWAFCWCYWIIITYEAMFEHDEASEHTKNSAYKLFFILFIFAASFFIFCLRTSPELYIPYSYLLVGATSYALAIGAALFLHPNLRRKFLYAGFYFFYSNLLFAWLAIQLHYWWYPKAGQVLFSMSFFGVTLPAEEFFLWILTGAVMVLSLYELFDDDGK